MANTHTFKLGETSYGHREEEFRAGLSALSREFRDVPVRTRVFWLLCTAIFGADADLGRRIGMIDWLVCTFIIFKKARKAQNEMAARRERNE